MYELHNTVIIIILSGSHLYFWKNICFASEPLSEKDILYLTDVPVMCIPPFYFLILFTDRTSDPSSTKHQQELHS